MTIDNRVTWMHSKQLGAPQMNGAKNSEGQMLQVLDACLIDGFNSQTVTAVSIAGNLATFTYGTAHGYELRQILVVLGADDPQMNGRHTITAKTDTSLTISLGDVAGAVTTTGTITTKIAPLGFESIFGSVNPLQRAYRSPNPLGTRTVLYLDMSYPASHGYDTANPAKRAMVDMCEDMTELGVQINSYTATYNKKPTNRNGQLFWYQARDYKKNVPVSSAYNSNWVIVGNSDYFYMLSTWYCQTGYPLVRPLRDINFFGDTISYGAPTDKMNCGWIGSIYKNDLPFNDQIYYSSNGARIGGYIDIANTPYGFLIGKANNTVGLDSFILTTSDHSSIQISGHSSDLRFNYPNSSTAGYIAQPLLIQTPENWRGIMPCLHFIPQNLGRGNSGPGTEGYTDLNTGLDISHLTHDLRVDNDMLIVAMHYYPTSSQEYMGYFALKLGA